MTKEQIRDYIYNGTGNKEEVFQVVLEAARKMAKRYKDSIKNEILNNECDLHTSWYVIFMDSLDKVGGICEQEHDELYFESGDGTPEQKQRLKELGDFLSPENIGLVFP